MSRTLIIAVSCLFLLGGCGLIQENEYDFTIKVSGSPGLNFSGHYSILGTDAQPQPVTAKGSVPLEYKGRGVMVIGYFRSLNQTGSLKVEILKEGTVVAQSETSIPYGYVSTKTPLPEKEAVISRLLKGILDDGK